MTRLIVLIPFTLAGCGPSGTENLHTSPPPAKVELVDITYAGLDQAVASHKGKVVAIDVWATFCVPCVKKFPDFVRLHRTHAAKGLVCISASTDSVEDREKALDFLKTHEAAFTNYRFSESNAKIDKALSEKYETDMQPVMFVFNRKGEKVRQFEGKETPEEVEAYLLKLLEEK